MKLPVAFSVPLAFAALLAAAPWSDTPRNQQPTLRVTITDSATRNPLENAEVLDLASSRVYFANSDGVAFVQWSGDNDLRLRVRQIGYRPVELVVKRSGAQVQSKNVALSRAIFRFDPLEVKTPCGTANPDAALPAAALLSQIRAAAERFDEFRKARPFRARLERVTSRRSTGTGRVNRTTNEETNSDKWGEKYKPGSVYIRSDLGFSIPFLFLSSLGDTVFWENHCFEAGGRTDAAGKTLFRLNFRPVPGLRSPDWSGSAMLDSASGSLVRIEFRLVGLRDDDRISRLEGYTTFVPVAPFIQVPDSSVAGWWYSSDATQSLEPPDVVQLLHVVNISFR